MSISVSVSPYELTAGIERRHSGKHDHAEFYSILAFSIGSTMTVPSTQTVM
jgi:hypothetical protein